MIWYPLYLLSVGVLWAFSSPRDRNALRILLIAAIGSSLLMWALRPIIAPEKLIVPATVESLTILALLQWARSRTGYMQAGLLGIAWLTHLTCFLDLKTGSNVVYDSYETILLWVAVGQIVACYDTFLHIWVALCDAVLRWTRPDNLCSGSRSVSVLRSPGSESLPPL